MVGVLAFSHIAIRVSDLDAALAFYRDALGFRDHSRLVVTDTPSFREAGLDDAEMVAHFLRLDRTVIELQVVRSASGRPIPATLGGTGYHHLAFRVDGVEATARTMAGAGGVVDWPTLTSNDGVGGSAIFGADPDGQRLELLQLRGGPHQPVGDPLDPGDVAADPAHAFDHVVLGVRDLDRALSFYAGCLGAVVESRDDAAAMVRVFDTRLGLRVVTDAEPTVGIRALALRGPHGTLFADPDGAPIEVLGATPAAAPAADRRRDRAMRLLDLSEHLGSEVLDVDLREPLADADRQRLRDAFAERHLLVFRGQEISADDQVRTCAIFGEPVDEGGDSRFHVFISTARADGVLGDGRPLLFHSDNMFTDAPLTAASLYGLVIDGEGAPTQFANTERAAALLPADVRAELDGAMALHLSGFAGGWYRYRDADVDAHHPRAWHPVLRVNARNGHEALCVSEQQADRIDGWDPERSEAMLQRLFAILYAEDNVVRHHWRAGDLVVWDNIACQHGRPAVAAGGERTLRRVAMVDSGAAEQAAWTKVSLAAEGKG